VDKTDRLIIYISGKDQKGIVASVSDYLYRRSFNITELDQFNDPFSENFFMRLEFSSENSNIDLEDFKISFSKEVINKFNLYWEIKLTQSVTPIIVMASLADHCLNDLLYRIQSNDLNAVVKAIVSNHEQLKERAEQYNIPFYFVPVTDLNRQEQEQKVIRIYKETKSELLVLARYMQILSDETTSFFKGKAINIHHSFLPGFKGGKPYHQAYTRGVKMIGATAHYITNDLDEGPIIDQEVIKVNHSMNPEKLIFMGKYIESLVLTRAVRLHLDKRVFLNHGRTVVFD
jgi:formyltetrahydrofolate deformylase